MKTRNDFVSNSSSSSFLLKESDLEEFKKKFPISSKHIVNLKTYQTSLINLKNDIKKMFDKYVSNIGMTLDTYAAANFDNIDEQLLYRINDITDTIDDLLNNISKVKEEYKEDFDNLHITIPIDRDHAYTIGFDKPVYMGDL